MKKIWKVLIIMTGLLVVLVAVAGCGGGGGGGTAAVTIQPVACPASNTINVSIQGFAFNPGTITVSANGIVKWTNNDSVTHTVTSTSAPSNNSFNAAVNPGSSVCLQFTTAGTYSYYCSIHPSMTGSLAVTASSSASGHRR
jgi:plastocyanin